MNKRLKTVLYLCYTNFLKKEKKKGLLIMFKKKKEIILKCFKQNQCVLVFLCVNRLYN